jgi:hypothetical protein
MTMIDYSAVAWPWEDDPNWAQPREGATYDPANGDNWAMASLSGVKTVRSPRCSYTWSGSGWGHHHQEEGRHDD